MQYKYTLHNALDKSYAIQVQFVLNKEPIGNSFDLIPDHGKNTNEKSLQIDHVHNEHNLIS